MSPKTDVWLIVVMCGLLLLPAGCNQGSEQVGTAIAKQDGAASVASKSEGIAQEKQPAANTQKVSAEAEAAVRQLQQLYSQAVTAESEFRFPDAVAAWKQTVTLLEKIHGVRSWQYRNGHLALATAEKQSSFSPHQVDRMKSLVAAQKEIALHLAKVDYKAGLAISRQMSTSTADLFGEDSWMKAKQDVQCARLEQLNGNTEVATGLYQSASGRILLHAGALHPELESVHGYLAECFGSLGNQKLALANHSKATALAETLWGTDSLQFAARANDLGAAYVAMGEHSTAVRILRVSEMIRRNVLGESHPLVAHSRLNLSVAYMGIGELQIAHDLVKQAEAIFRSMPNGQDFLVQAMRQRATTLMLSNLPEQAEVPLRELIDFASRANDGGLLAAEYRYRLAVCLGRQGKFAEAGTVAQQVLETRAVMLGASDTETVKARELLVQMHDRANQPARAAEAGGSVRPASFTMPETGK